MIVSRNLRLISRAALFATVLSATLRSDAAVVQFADAASFNAAFTGTLTLEDLEQSPDINNTLPGEIDLFGAPLTSSGPQPFAPNDIVSGLTITQSGGIDDNATELFAANGNVLGIGTFPSVVVGAFQNLSTLDLIFASPIAAIGFDAFTAGILPMDTLIVTLLDAANNPLFTSGPIQVTNTSPTFVGFVSDLNDISTVRLSAGTVALPGIEAVDNIAFGTIQPAAVPEPSSLALLGLLGLAGGGLKWRRRRAAAA